MRYAIRVSIVAGFALLTVVRPVELSAQGKPTGQSPDVSFAVATVTRFHELLAAGDSASATNLLAPDLTVLESGGIESRAEYLAHHIGADIEFARAVPVTRQVVSAKRQGDVVWIVAASEAKGTMRGRPVESRGAELMVLSRSGRAWQIRAIHWSSRSRRRGTP